VFRRSARGANHSATRFALTRYNPLVSYDDIPDVRDGLTRKERVVLYVLHQVQKERGEYNVPTTMLWGRVCEHFYISPEALSAMLARLGARRDWTP
jgi:hypothetical protein